MYYYNNIKGAFMNIKKDILEYCLKYWNDNFCGISSHQVSTDLQIRHEKVRQTLRKLKEENKGTLNDDVVISLDETGREREIAKKGDREKLITIFFPSREILTDYFNNSGLSKKDIPEYKKKLHLGHNQTELFYFPAEVLKKYTDDPENYNLCDTLCGGFLTIKSDDSYTLRYGKRKINEDERVVAVALDDLSELDPSEQQYWHTLELETPEFSVDDPDFHEFYLRYYEITPVDSYDPLHDLIATIRKINSLSHVGNLLGNVDNSRLKYPVKNTYKSFYKACKELSRVIAPNSINKKALKEYLCKNYNGYDNLKDEKEDCDINELFINLLKEINFIDSSITSLKRKVRSLDKISSGDYLDKFKKLCKNLLLWHRILHRKLKNKKPATFKKYIRPAHLNNKNKNKYLSLR